MTRSASAPRWGWRCSPKLRLTYFFPGFGDEFCQHCSASLWDNPPSQPKGGGLADWGLILGILELIFGPLAGIPGVLVCSSAIKAIGEGREYAGGLGKAKWGRYLSVAGTVLIIGYCAYWISHLRINILD